MDPPSRSIDIEHIEETDERVIEMASALKLMALELANLERYNHGKRKDIQSLAHPLKRPSLEARVVQCVMRLRNRNRNRKTTRIKTTPHDQYIRYRSEPLLSPRDEGK